MTVSTNTLQFAKNVLIESEYNCSSNERSTGAEPQPDTATISPWLNSATLRLHTSCISLFSKVRGILKRLLLQRPKTILLCKGNVSFWSSLCSSASRLTKYHMRRIQREQTIHFPTLLTFVIHGIIEYAYKSIIGIKSGAAHLLVTLNSGIPQRKTYA